MRSRITNFGKRVLASRLRSSYLFAAASFPHQVRSLERQRLDKWLWHARVVKARTSAAALVEAGHVRINGVRETAPGHAVKAGDVLTIALDRSVRILEVAGFTERRRDAASARALFVDLQKRAE
jgi:ribosome-associated heat shock protein Hsp15